MRHIDGEYHSATAAPVVIGKAWFFDRYFHLLSLAMAQKWPKRFEGKVYVKSASISTSYGFFTTLHSFIKHIVGSGKQSLYRVNNLFYSNSKFLYLLFLLELASVVQRWWIFLTQFEYVEFQELVVLFVVSG